VEVFLPRAAAADETIEAGETHAGEAPTDRGTILLVDDNPDVREIAAFFLREAGYIVREAASGPQARDILAAGPVSLALVDYAMPTMSGHEFVFLARQMQPNLPVVYLTGAADRLVTGTLPVGDPVLMKPYVRASLLKIVRERVLPATASK
jgi:CheY-like chemotaxis protein